MSTIELWLRTSAKTVPRRPGSTEIAAGVPPTGGSTPGMRNEIAASASGVGGGGGGLAAGLDAEPDVDPRLPDGAEASPAVVAVDSACVADTR